MNRKMTMEFGANYLPHVDSIRDFYPHWIEPRWDESRVRRDLMILRSLGGRWMRYHILPTDYQRDQYPGAEADMYRRLVPHALRICHDLGMKTHVDLHTDDFSALRIEDLLARVREFGIGNIDYLQVINEYFYLWKSAENLDHLESLLLALREHGVTVPMGWDAGGSVHRSIRRTHPRLAQFVSQVLPMHHYTYGMRWDDLGIDTFLDLLTDGRRALQRPLLPEQRAYWDGMLAEHFAGLAPELRVMEINSVSFPVWPQMVLHGRAEHWPIMMHRLAAETNVRVVCHWCLRGKLSWREYGGVSCGLLWPSELPKPEAFIFRRTAMDMMPPEDIYARVELDISLDATGCAIATLLNKTAHDMPGRLINARGDAIAVTVPGASRATQVLRDTAWPAGDADSAVVHHFAEFVPDHASGMDGRCIGWCAVPRQRPVQLHEGVPFPASAVHYPDGLAPVTNFLEAHRDRLAIVFETVAGLESELAIRLQCAMTEGWGIEPLLAALSYGGSDLLLDRALVLPLVRGQCALARCVERLVGRRYSDFVDACGDGSPGASISAHPGVFARPAAEPGHPVSSVSYMIGDTSFCPGAVVILASSFELLRDAVHDLIQRIVAPGRMARTYARDERERNAGLPLAEARTFAVMLPPGEYDIALAVGSHRLESPFCTRTRVDKINVDRTDRTHGNLVWLEATARLAGQVQFSFSPAEGLAACPSAMVITDRATGARRFKCYFHHAPRVDMDYEGFIQIDERRRFGQANQAAAWDNVRAASNEFVNESNTCGWI